MAEKSEKAKESNEKIAIIRLRGSEGVKVSINDTMRMLKMLKKHVCVVYDKTPVILGMAVKCKDYVTYGEIDEETHKLLLEKRPVNDPKTGKPANYFHLNSPRGGLGKKGIKDSYQNKGALGYRGAKINDFIKKMI